MKITTCKNCGRLIEERLSSTGWVHGNGAVWCSDPHNTKAEPSQPVSEQK